MALKQREYVSSQEGTIEKIHCRFVQSNPGQGMNILWPQGLNIAGEMMSNRHPVTVG